MWTARLINVEEAYQMALRIKKQMGPSFGRKMSSMNSRQERVTTPSLLKDQSKGAIEGN